MREGIKGLKHTSKSRTRIIPHTVMIIVAIIGGMGIGWIVGMWVVDRYINTNHEDIDKTQN